MPKSPPPVSVVLPFYNAEQTLERAMQSIAGQQFADFECLLVDNNSTDGSRELALEMAKRDKRFRLLSESRQGVAFASNKGAEAARGKFIARMDADDVSLPGRLKLQYELLTKKPALGAVAGLVRHVPEMPNTGGFSRYVDWVNSIRTYEEIRNNQFVELPVVNPSAMWRKEVGEKFGLYRSGAFPEDYEMWLRWLAAGVRVEKVPEEVLLWHDRPGRLTRTRPEYSDKAFYLVKSSYLAGWLQQHNPFHPKVVVWGASRISRRRARLLEAHGIEITCYIDTKRSRRLDLPVIYYEDLPNAGEMFILTYIKQMDAREEIKAFLNSRNYREGVDYLLVS